MGNPKPSSGFYIFFILLWIFPLHAQTTVQKLDGEWQLLVDGKPFEVKGATFGYDHDVANYDSYFMDLQFLGVNTIRTWTTDQNTQMLLDAAHKHGIKVMVGIWMRHGRPGMEDDDSFDYLEDKAGMEVMRKNAIHTVNTYKDHPAVLSWGVGNEVYLNMATDGEKKAYSKFLESICGEIKKLDGSHPITSVDAWTFGMDWWQKYVPSLDIYGLNSYGPGANLLDAEMKKRGIDKPYLITEFGVTGEWDISERKNDIVVEPSDREKYNTIVEGYHNWIKNKPNCLGVYVFHYSNGEDFLAIWLLSHFKKKKRPQYWAIREAFTGKKPVNAVPSITEFRLPESSYASGNWVPINLHVEDLEEEKLAFHFYYNQRSGSRKRRNQVIPLNFRGSLAKGFELQLPAENGPIKIYATATDFFGNVGIASSSMVVTDEEAAKRTYLVPRVSLPFYVYKEPQNVPYAPSGYMGNYKAISVDMEFKEEHHSAPSCIKIGYSARDNWYGVGFVDPANDWGNILGGYDISGAKTFSFWAKASDNNVNATIGFGLIDKDKPYPDTSKKSIEITLTQQWKKYTIKVKKLDLSCIRSGLVVFSSSNGFAQDIFIDDVVFE
nr:glycoside hydrolase family 2 TIM barrel-domain containing protein [Allomuricauda sp.]